jgi:hypothetical protein
MKIPPAKGLRRAELLEAIGYTNPDSGPAGSAMGALAMFGLVEKREALYMLTPLGRTLRSPLSETQGSVLRMLSLLLPERFREFYNELKGQTFNRTGHVEKLVKLGYAVTDKVALLFEETFIQSGLKGGLIVEVNHDRVRVRNIGSFFPLLETDFQSYGTVTDNILDLTASEGFCKRLLDSIEATSATRSGTTQESSSQEVREVLDTGFDFSEAIVGNHELVRFELDDGTYVVTKKELSDFVRQQGRRLSTRKLKL